MIVLYIIILLLILIIIFLSLTLYVFSKKHTYFSDKEKEFIYFTFQIFSEYSSELGIQSKEQHEKLVIELKKIENKLKNNV